MLSLLLFFIPPSFLYASGIHIDIFLYRPIVIFSEELHKTAFQKGQISQIQASRFFRSPKTIRLFSKYLSIIFHSTKELLSDFSILIFLSILLQLFDLAKGIFVILGLAIFSQQYSTAQFDRIDILSAGGSIIAGIYTAFDWIAWEITFWQILFAIIGALCGFLVYSFIIRSLRNQSQ
jgi:hypothetical protein